MFQKADQAFRNAALDPLNKLIELQPRLQPRTKCIHEKYYLFPAGLACQHSYIFTDFYGFADGPGEIQRSHQRYSYSYKDQCMVFRFKDERHGLLCYIFRGWCTKNAEGE